jgi:hypothetical protein
MYTLPLYKLASNLQTSKPVLSWSCTHQHAAAGVHGSVAALQLCAQCLLAAGSATAAAVLTRALLGVGLRP